MDLTSCHTFSSRQFSSGPHFCTYVDTPAFWAMLRTKGTFPRWAKCQHTEFYYTLFEDQIYTLDYDPTEIGPWGQLTRLCHTGSGSIVIAEYGSPGQRTAEEIFTKLPEVVMEAVL